MKRLLLAAAFGVAGLFATATDALAQRTDTTYVKPQLPTGPPAVPPPAPSQPTRPVQTQPQQPTQPQPTQPVRPSGGIDDDGRSAQPLPGSRPTQPTAPATPQRPGGGIDDDGRPAQTLPQNGTVPGATLQSEYQPGKLFLYGSLLRFGLGNNQFNGADFSAGFAPALGYRITERLTVAAGPVGVYHSTDFGPNAGSFGLPRSMSFKDLGVRGLAQFTVYKSFFLQAEYESTRVQDYSLAEIVRGQQYEARKVNINTQAFLVGVGYRQSLGDRFAVDGALLYNTNYDRNYYGVLIQRLSFLYYLGGK